jgi:methyl-accepting chemotaxis protein
MYKEEEKVEKVKTKFIKRKKLNLSVKRDLQIKLISKIFLVVMAASLINGAIFYFYSNRRITDTYYSAHITAENFLEYLLPAVIAAVLVALWVAIFISLFYPQKIAGPIYRLETDIKRLGNGDLVTPLSLRKGDHFQDLAGAINLSIEKLRERIEKAKCLLDELESVQLNGNGEKAKEMTVALKEVLGGLKSKKG